MRHEPLLRNVAVGVLVGLSLLAACAKAPSHTDNAAEDTTTFVLGDNAGSISRVERAVSSDGRETLHGETEILGKTGLGRVVEDATLDAAGALVHAEIAVFSRCDRGPDRRLVIDRARGMVELHEGSATERWRVWSDAPWTIAPLSDAAGNAVATPVSAWITARAAHGPSVRVIDADHRWSFRTPTDQVAVADGEGLTVTVGDDTFDAGKNFIEAIHLRRGGLTLTLLDEAALPPQLACGSFGKPGVSRLQ